jgi:hypothetical protein
MIQKPFLDGSKHRPDYIIPYNGRQGALFAFTKFISSKSDIFNV